MYDGVGKEQLLPGHIFHLGFLVRYWRGANYRAFGHKNSVPLVKDLSHFFHSFPFPSPIFSFLGSHLLCV